MVKETEQVWEVNFDKLLINPWLIYLKIVVYREENGRKRVRMLQKKLVDIQKEKEVELQQRNNMIAHFKDQLQEMTAKTKMEGKYLKKSAEVAVAQTQKKCQLSEKELQEEIEVGHCFYFTCA